MTKPNYWDVFEYNKLKLLLHEEKVGSMLQVLKGEKEYDELYPISVELHLTNLCNLKCPWCTDKELRRKHAILPFDIIDTLFEEFEKFGVGITLEGGGEPTLHNHFEDIVKLGKKHNLDMGLITNGTQDISNIVHLFKWIRVSLDSSHPEEYVREKGVDCFEQVINNIQDMSNHRDPEDTFLGIGYVLTKNNYSHLQETIQRLDHIGVDYIYFRPVEEAQEMIPEVMELYDLKNKMTEWFEGKRIKYLFNIAGRLVDCNMDLPCVAHSLTSIIHADGEVAMCEKRRNGEVSFGNVQKTSFYEIWNSDIRKQFSKKLMDRNEQQLCRVCRVTEFNSILNHLDTVHTQSFI